MNFSEGVKESLRRLSSIIWMAEELHRVADFLLPNTSVSTYLYLPNSNMINVHKQIFETGCNFSTSKLH
jgi:hypothetical protein